MFKYLKMTMEGTGRQGSIDKPRDTSDRSTQLKGPPSVGS